jgi:hypothetical protein
MTAAKNRQKKQLPKPEQPPYIVSSGTLQINTETWKIRVRKTHARSDAPGWLEIDIGAAWLPAGPTNPNPMQLRNRPEMCWTIVAALDTYLLRQKGSKSGHVVASDIVRYLTKLFEYFWLNGFYRIQDVPREAWEPLRKHLVRGGWVAALEIERRTIGLLDSSNHIAHEFLRKGQRKATTFSVRTSFLSALGTNIAARELQWAKTLLEQAAGYCPRTGSPAEYQRIPLKPMSQTMLLQVLRAFDTLADVQGPLGLTYLPTANAFEYAKKHGRKGGRTTNLSPEVAARLLAHSYKWVTDIGPKVVALVEACGVQFAFLHTPEFNNRYSTPASADALRSQRANEILAALPEREELEILLGKKVRGLTKRTPQAQQVSLYALLNQLLSACFTVIALMNGRRKDEVSHEAIGLHRSCVRVVDAELGLAESEFYIEKTFRDYKWFFIGDITQRAIGLLQHLSDIAWGWAIHVRGKPEPRDRDFKIFCFPAFASSSKRGMLWFDFNANPGGMASDFLAQALGDQADDFVVTPHMFRRGYGLIYHYRYENATLIALAQKYGHLDLGSTLHYVTNDANTPLGAHAAAMWAAPKRTFADHQQQHFAVLAGEIDTVGREKLHTFVEQVVAGIGSFSGGFVRLVQRFHRRLSSHVDYGALKKTSQAQSLSTALLARGHSPHPYRHATCMAGAYRRAAACTRDGRLARERSGPVVCSGCAYSVIIQSHVEAMREDARELQGVIKQSKATVERDRAECDLRNLERVIWLQTQRLMLNDEAV